MQVKNTYKKIPYYEPNANLRDQIKKSSSQKKLKKHLLIIKKLKNYLLETLAYNCPVNSKKQRGHILEETTGSHLKY